MNRQLSHYSLIVVILLALSACSVNRTRLPYFEDLANDTQGLIPASDYQVTIHSDDELMITVTSIVAEATMEYNLPQINPATSTTLLQATQPRTLTYRVDKEGDIKFPQLGRIHVAGITPDSLANYIARRISSDVKDPFVKVDLVNYRVNVLGEVNKPGAYTVTRHRYTILEALADAGDLTPYGERNNVLLIREENGANQYYRINLNSSDFLSQPYFFLRQNDVIYVEPNDIRRSQARYNQNDAFKIQTLSTIMSTVSVIFSVCMTFIRLK